MSAPGDYRDLFRGSLATISDYRCRACRGGLGGEEVSSAESVVFVRSGVFARRMRGREDLDEAGRVVFFNRGEPYQVAHPAHCGDRCAIFRLPRSVLEDMVRVHDPGAADQTGPLFAPLSARVSPALLLEQRHLVADLTRPGGMVAAEEAVMDLVGRVIGEVYREGGLRVRGRRPDTAAAHQSAVRGVREVLSVGWREAWTLAELARRVHCSPYHLARMFKQEMGMTIGRYSARLRLTHALEHLAEGEGLALVASRLGFCDQSHFTNAFTREFGVPPGRVRGRLRGRNLR